MLAAQKTYGYKPLVKVVLTKAAATTYGYSLTEPTKLYNIQTIEQPYSQQGNIYLDNQAGTFTDLDLKGYQAVISWGAHTAAARTAWAAGTVYAVGDIRVPTTANGYQYICTVAGTSAAVVEPTWPTGLGVTVVDNTVTWAMHGASGDEYSDTAPLTVIAQQPLTKKGQHTCSLVAVGIPNLLAWDKASANYLPTSADTKTVKTMLTDIFTNLTGAGACFSHCTAYTISWDSEDSLIDSFAPKDGFRINKGGSRLDAVKRLLSYTGCVMRFESDSKVHIFVPKISGDTWAVGTAYVVNDYVQPTTPNNNFTYQCTTAGTSHATTEPTWPTTAGQTVSDGTAVWTARAHDYTYSSVAGEHNFFATSNRRRLVIPGYVQVDSRAADGDGYTGYAQDTDTPSALRKRDYIELRLTSNAQATAIAKAQLKHHQLDSERGAGEVPMNFGTEVYDYVKVTDSDSNVRIGNCGILARTFARGKPLRMDFRYGGIEVGQNLGGIYGGTDIGEAVRQVNVDALENTLSEIYGYISQFDDRLDKIEAVYSAATFIIDGGGAAITTGQKGHIVIPFAGTVVEAILLADQTGSIVIDVWKDTIANFPPTDADSITASAPPTLDAEQGMIDTTLTGWTTAIAADDVMAFNVDSAATITRATLVLVIRKA